MKKQLENLQNNTSFLDLIVEYDALNMVLDSDIEPSSSISRLCWFYYRELY